ncbi:MAG: ATP-NAD kinase [Planctomycetaceae bacterium]|nr:ATP-NAD kinase [Planctomycetaceae bacterium]
MKKVGLLVNPVAGMGGAVGLKGSDGAAILREARLRGAVPHAPRRVVQALRAISRIKDQIQLITCPHEMGEDEARTCGLVPQVIGSITRGATTAEDTLRGAGQLEQLGLDLLLFAGGDGTARDIYHAVGQRVPALGIPAGVKIHSAVFGVTPRHAGEVAVRFLEGKLALQEAEVMDIDEDAFRRGTVSASLLGYLRSPRDRKFVQSVKSGGTAGEQEVLLSIAADTIEQMDPARLYLVGPGTTTRAVLEQLGIPATLLGVDVVLDKRLVAGDVNEKQLQQLVDRRPATIVLSVIGGQGYILGRGNQQLSPAVLTTVGTENLVVLASQEKLVSLAGKPLLVDTGDEELDRTLCGYLKVTTGFREYSMVKVGCQENR